MQSERYDSIEYNDEWESVPVVRAEPVTSHYDYDNDLDEDEEDYDTYSGQSDGYKSFEDIKPKKNEGTPQPVIKLQFLLGFLVLATAFILKNYGGELYTTVSEWYFNNLNNSLIVTMKSQDENVLSDEESTENSVSTTDIAEKATEEQTGINNISTEQATPTEEYTEESGSEVSSEESTQDNTEITQSNEEENEY